MSRNIGSAGRQAYQLALGRKTKLASRAIQAKSSERSLPLLQRTQTDPNGSAVTPASADGLSPGSDQGQAAVEREKRSPSPEEIADRVYELLRQDFRQGRER